MDKPKAELFLDEQLPHKHQALVVPALRSAYESVEALIAETDFLQISSAQPGHLRAWAADLAVKRLIETGKWPYDFDWQPFKRDTGNWLRVRLPESVMSVHQLAEASNTPRKAEYRSNGFFNNQGVLELPELVEERRLDGLPHLVLTHGHNDLSFIHIGLPSTDGRGYIARSQNLLKHLHVVETGVAPPEGVGVEPDVKLRKKSKESEELTDEIVRLIKDRG
jgi:hypothetical protein